MLTKVFNYQFFIVFLWILSGCSLTPRQTELSTAKIPDLVLNSGTEKPLKSQSLPHHYLQSDLYYHAFNQQKFRTTVPSILVGVEVFDMSLNSYAHVTNKVVAVLKDSSQFDEGVFFDVLASKSKFSTHDKVVFNFVANSVVEFTFIHKKVNMLTMYQIISAMPNVAQTELLLQYRDKNSPSQF